MMTLNPSLNEQVAESGSYGAVVHLPLDYPRHKRIYSFVEEKQPLEERLSRTLDRKLKGAELETTLSAVFFAWMQRLTNEKELSAGLAGAEGGETVVSLALESADTFQDIGDLIRQALPASGGGTGAACDARFAVGRSPEARQELINWQMTEQKDGWSVTVVYDASLFRAETIKRYIFYYLRLLEAALDNPRGRYASVDILTPEDAAVYERTNATEAEYPRDQTIHGMFERTAAAMPDRIALSSAGGELTYRQLNEKANETARMLIGKGLQKGDFVTIYMERSQELIVSLLGILKAGGVYVPVDPDHPAERNRYIVEDTESVFVLTKERYQAEARDLCAPIATVREIIAVDGGFPEYEGAANPDAGVKPQDLAYVIYTSGSTGRPKGALIAHEGVVNLGETVRRDCRIEPGDVLTQFATYSFDASVWDTIGALFYGATLYLLSPEERVSVEEFALAVERTGTTIIAILPTVFFNQLSAYLSEEGYRRLAKVKLITVAGEALYGEQVRAFQRKFKDAIDIVNVYGPTECTVCTTTHVVRGYIPDDLVNIPIGRPIRNYKVYILNEDFRLCPVNVPGEVYISTVGLAKGYLHQPEKTAEAFLPNPFEEGGTIYKSGDIAKLLPDGSIEYVGRRDSQIKIRGHRIEIGEIEDNFIKIPNVQDVAVIAKKDKDGQNMLVGYFTSRDGSKMSPLEIKRQLGERLPSYFVPKWIIQLDRIPVSPTGKLDRKKLASLDVREELQPEGEAYVAPASELHRLIADAWMEGLGLERVGMEDDFFEIGGDSLAIMHVLALLKRDYPGLRINDFYRYRTIAKLADRIRELEREAAPAENAVSGGSKVALNEWPETVGNGLTELRADSPSAILLTGATGYLGSRLLYDLLVHSDADVYCLVRSKGAQSGQARLEETMVHYFGQAALSLMTGRVAAVEGELERPGLGLSEEQRRKLQGRIDAIVHSAADVRHFGEAGQFEKSNLLGTKHLIALAQEAERPIRFHHISTLGIPEDLALSGQWESLRGERSFPADVRVDNLYTNSKLEAEKALFAAADRGLSVTVYRVGNLSCHSESGSFQRNIDSNAFYRMFKAMLLLGKAPEADWEVDFTPIDYAGKAIVHLALRSDTAGRVIHICNPETIPYAKLVEAIRSLGYKVETMPFAAYSDWLLRSNRDHDPEALKLAIAQLEGDGAKNSNYRYGCESTAAYLEGSGIHCPAPDEGFIRRMFSYAAHIGYLPKPEKIRQPIPV